MKKLEDIANIFLGNKSKLSVKAFGNGHIHETFVVQNNAQKARYILQKINRLVFTQPELLIANHLKLSSHFQVQEKPLYQIPAILPQLDADTYLYYDEEGAPWRLMEFIDESYSLELIEEPALAREAGAAYGWFVALTEALDPSDFTLSIPGFHSILARNKQLEEAIAENKVGRKASCSEIIEFFQDRKSVFEQLELLANSSEIPVRIMHNDTKINNVLFKNGKAAALIDLDTIGPGLIFYDYGDSLRTIANFSLEDERNLSKTGFNKEAFVAYTRGYLSQVTKILTGNELKFLHLAPQMMTYVIGIRFLTDYLNGDTYFKTKYTEHNLVRTLVQKRLLESMESENEYIKSSIHSISQKFKEK